MFVKRESASREAVNYYGLAKIRSVIKRVLNHESQVSLIVLKQVNSRTTYDSGIH